MRKAIVSPARAVGFTAVADGVEDGPASTPPQAEGGDVATDSTSASRAHQARVTRRVRPPCERWCGRVPRRNGDGGGSSRQRTAGCLLRCPFGKGAPAKPG